MSAKPDHPSLGFPTTGQPLGRSGNSTTNLSPTDPPGPNSVQRSPYTMSAGLNAGNKMGCNTRSGAGSPSHEIGNTNRIFSKRAREIQAQEGVPVNVWGPPTSGNSTPLRENIPESPNDGLPSYSHPAASEVQPGTTRRARAGTVPSRFSPGGVSNGVSLPAAMTKTSRLTPPSSYKSPSPVSSEHVDNRNSVLLSRLRAGSMPQRSQYPPKSAGPFGPSVFSTNWSSGRERTSTLASIASQGSNHPSSPSQSAFCRETGGDTDMQMRTLDYLGLADTPQPPRATIVNPLLANLANISKQSNRFRSYSVNAKEKYAEDEEEYVTGSMTPYEAQQAQLHMQLAATHAAIQQHNLAVQAYANQASQSRPRARTAGILESPASRMLKNHFPSTSRLDNRINTSEIGLNDDFEDLSMATSAMSLGRSTSRNDYLNPEDKSEGPTRALWLGSIPLSTTVSTLTEMFKHHGPIISARVLTHKNCGFVNFERLESAISAKALMNGKEIFPGAGPIRINFAKPPSPSGSPEDETHFSSSSPDLFAKGDKDTDQNSIPTNLIPRPGAISITVPALVEMKKEILRIVGEFGASIEEKSKIASSIDASVLFTAYQSEIPPVPEPSLNRIHDAPKLRDIRKRIDNQSLTIAEIESIASGILPEIVELSSDYLGNTVVQKLFEHCSDGVRDIMLAEIAPHMAEIGVHKNGTWAAQKIIDVCKTPNQMNMIIKNLHSYAVPLFLDQYGNYVLQCCLKFGSPYNNFIFESMLSQMWEIAQGRYGARAMRACLESHHSTKDQQRMFAAAIALHSVQLATSANGALLLTWFLDTCTFPQRRSVLAPQIIPHLVHLCTHKVAYLTVLKGINQKQEPEAKEKIYRAIFFSPKDEILEAILSDHACGATLIFKVITTPFFDESIRSEVLEKIRNVLIRLKAQPAQGYKRLMDEVALSPRGLSNGPSREHVPNGNVERNRPVSNQGQVNSLQIMPQQYGNMYFPPIPPADFDVGLSRPDGIDSNLPPYLPYGPIFNSPGISPMNLQQIQYQQSLFVRAASPMNNVHHAIQPGFVGFHNESPGPDHYRNQTPQASMNYVPNVPPGFNGTGNIGANHGYMSMNGTRIGYGLQAQEQINGRSRRVGNISCPA